MTVQVFCRCGEPARYWVNWPDHGRNPMCPRCARAAADTAAALGWNLTLPQDMEAAG